MQDTTSKPDLVEVMKRALAAHPFSNHERDPERINRMPEKFQQVWLRHPDYRLTQMLVVATGASQPYPELFYSEDGVLLHALESFELGGSK